VSEHKDISKAQRAVFITLVDEIRAAQRGVWEAKDAMTAAEDAYKMEIAKFLKTDSFEISSTICNGSREPPFNRGLDCVWAGWHDNRHCIYCGSPEHDLF
jgi:hypothetical protein